MGGVDSGVGGNGDCSLVIFWGWLTLAFRVSPSGGISGHLCGELLEEVGEGGEVNMGFMRLDGVMKYFMASMIQERVPQPL